MMKWVYFFGFILFMNIPYLFSDESSSLEEFKIKREANFEFVKKPNFSKKGNDIVIDFETAGFCDVTIVVERLNDGKIVRHIVSGVLGSNAPEPFQKNSKKQSIIWDGKDDAGVYLDEIENLRIRVSLGLKPQYERNVLSSPYKNVSTRKVLLASHPEGVLLYEGLGVDSIKLFDHDGKYKRTIYPFSSAKLKEVKGLKMHTFPQDGKSIALKSGHVQATLLTSGNNGANDIFGINSAANFIATHKETLLIGSERLNWLGMDGSTAGRELNGPDIRYDVGLGTIHEFVGGIYKIGPSSVAFSPDGKYAYLTSYTWNYTWHQGALNVVTRLDLSKNEAPVIWKGTAEKNKTGEAPADFKQPTSIACDSQGRVYISDYFNDRIQVFQADGSFVKSIPCKKPVKIQINQKNNSIYVFSWYLSSYHWPKEKDQSLVPSTLTYIHSLEQANKTEVYNLPLVEPMKEREHLSTGWLRAAEIDFYAEDELVIWMIPGNKYVNGMLNYQL